MTRFALVFVLAFLVIAPTVRHRNVGDCGGSSRLATVESLVERGSFALKGSSFPYTCDVMKKDGKSYSDKPPLLSVAAAGLYFVLHRGLGLGFDRSAVPVGARPPHDHTYLLMTLLVVGVAHALLVALFERAAGELGLVSGARTLATLSLALGTLLWPLSGLFNSHTVAALLIFAGLRAALLLGPARPASAGLLLALGAAVDIPVGALALALGMLLIPGGWQPRLRLALGALPPLALHGACNWWIVGDLVPFQMHRELYDASTGHAGESATGFAQTAGLAFYAARNLTGSLGVFSLTPLLLLALPLALGVVTTPSLGRAPARPAPVRFALAASLLFVTVLALYVVLWPEAVGCAYGMRHLVPVTPPLLLAAASLLNSRRIRRAWSLLALFSAILAAGGLANAATCAGFVSDARGLVPARVFFANLEVEVLPRLRR